MNLIAKKSSELLRTIVSALKGDGTKCSSVSRQKNDNMEFHGRAVPKT